MTISEMRSNERTVKLLLVNKPPAPSCAQFGSIKAPTLVMVGDRATPFFRKVSDKTAHCLPDARIVILPGAHLMSFEDPQPFNRALLTFLADHGG